MHNVSRMRFFLLSVFLYSCPLTTMAQPSDKTERTVLDLSKRKFDWIIKKNYDSLTTFLDDRIQFVHSNGWVQNKQEIIDDLKSGKLNYQKITVNDAKARVYGASVIVLGTGTFEGINQEKPFSMELRYTEVYVRSGNSWKLASRHANRLP